MTSVPLTRSPEGWLGKKSISRPGFFFDIRPKTQGEKNLKLKLKNFLPKTQNSGIFTEIQEDFYPNITIFDLKSGKIVQKLKDLPKTQGKIS